METKRIIPCGSPQYQNLCNNVVSGYRAGVAETKVTDTSDTNVVYDCQQDTGDDKTTIQSLAIDTGGGLSVQDWIADSANEDSNRQVMKTLTLKASRGFLPGGMDRPMELIYPSALNRNRGSHAHQCSSYSSFYVAPLWRNAGVDVIRCSFSPEFGHR